MGSFATAILSALYYNTNKAKAAPQAEAADFNPFISTVGTIHKSTAEEFFRLTNLKLIPGWAVALAPIKELRRVAGKAPPTRRGIRTA